MKMMEMDEPVEFIRLQPRSLFDLAKAALINLYSAYTDKRWRECRELKRMYTLYISFVPPDMSSLNTPSIAFCCSTEFLANNTGFDFDFLDLPHVWVILTSICETHCLRERAYGVAQPGHICDRLTNDVKRAGWFPYAVAFFSTCDSVRVSSWWDDNGVVEALYADLVSISSKYSASSRCDDVVRTLFENLFVRKMTFGINFRSAKRPSQLPHEHYLLLD